MTHTYMSLYQSKIRKTIQRDIYKKPTFSVKLFDREYFGTIKVKSILGIPFRRYQIMGIDIDLDKTKIEEAKKIIKEQFWTSWRNLFFQRGISNEIVNFDLYDFKEPEFANNLRESRIFLRKYLETEHDLLFAFRENMPESGIICDFTKSDEELLSEMNESSRERVKKGIKKDIEFREAEEADYEEFFQKRQETAGKKWFNTIPKWQYYTLVTQLKSHNLGNLFITKDKWNILSWTICLYNEKTIVGLYSFTDRNHTNSGGQQYAKFRIYKRARERGFTHYDTMWWAPTGFPEHELASVSAFKESMWGSKIEYMGNYDIVLNKPMYKLLKWYYNKKH